MAIKKKRRITFAKQTVAARLELEVYREFMRDCEADGENVADKLRLIVREHYKAKRRKLQSCEDSEDPVKELFRQTVAEELAPLKAALGHLADITYKVTNLEELLGDLKTSASANAEGGSDQITQEAFSSMSRAQDGLANLLRQQAERLGWLSPIILAQHRLTTILHVKTGSTYNLLKYVATNPECTAKNQGERRKYLEAMFSTWENQMRVQDGEVKTEAAQEAMHFNLELPAGASSADLISDEGDVSKFISERTEVGTVAV